LCGNRNYTLAKNVTFSEILPFFLTSSFFIDYFPPEFTMEDVTSYRVKPSLIRIPSAMINGEPLHGDMAILTTASDALSDIGYQLKGIAFDEINLWDLVEDSKRLSGKGIGAYGKGNIYDAAMENLDLIHDRVENRFAVEGKFDWLTLFFLISTAAYDNDTTSRFEKLARTDPQIFFKKRTEWEAKPELKPDGTKTWNGHTFSFDTDKLQVLDEEEMKRVYSREIGQLTKEVEE